MRKCFDLCLDMVRDGTAGCARIVLVVLTVLFLEIALDALVDLQEEVPDSSDL